MNRLNEYGLEVINAYQPCLEQEDIFNDEAKRDDFSGSMKNSLIFSLHPPKSVGDTCQKYVVIISAAVMRFQDFYGVCGGISVVV